MLWIDFIVWGLISWLVKKNTYSRGRILEGDCPEEKYEPFVYKCLNQVCLGLNSRISDITTKSTNIDYHEHFTVC